MSGDSVDDELTAFLRSLGATDEQIAAAMRREQLTGLAADVVLSRGATLTATDLAARTNSTVDQVLNVWRLLDVGVPGPDYPMFTESDVRFLVDAYQLGAMDSRGELLRVLGSSMARLAEAAVSFYVQTVESEFDTPGSDPVVWAKNTATTALGALRLSESMGAVFVHHLQEAITRQRAAQSGASERTLFRLAVGFVDLVGFTPISRSATPAELLELINRFEARAFDVAAANHGRIVKHIGDEIMFVALDAAAGCAIASSLTNAFDGDGIEPRAGVAFGDVISRHGDYYGPVVNLASRLADLAIPHEVLVDAGTARAAASSPLTFVPAGRRLLKGFDQPAEVYSVALPRSGDG